METKCEIARQCGGCQIQALSYDRQLKYKENKVRNNLLRIGGFDEKLIDWVMDPIVGMEEPWNYRNKAQYPIGYDKNGELIAGFYAGRTHSIISCEDCLIGDLGNKEILNIILNYMKKNDIPAYDEEKKVGIVRHVLFRKGFNSGEWMVCLILNKKPGKAGDSMRKVSSNLAEKREASWISEKEFLPNQSDLINRLSKIEGMTSISVNINTENTNVIMGKDTYCIWGKPYITDTIQARDMTVEGYPFTGRKLEFHISPQSFYQVNPRQTEKLYSLALQYAGLTGKESVWDLYCGIGTISLFLAEKAGAIYGVEIVPQAIEDAKDNARRNEIKNAKFLVGKAEEVLPEFYSKTINDSARVSTPGGAINVANRISENMIKPDVIVVDPPRKGCDEACLQTMVAMNPEKIVYVSCDSATLARDLKYLCARGYNLVKVRPVDMFPHTVHVETVVLLTHQRKPDDYLKIHVDLDELDLTKSESKATYEEIRNYVKDKHNMRVTNLYIAQVKRDMGIIERINYNVGDGKAKVPQCPKDKYEAIVDALKHFQMIA